MYNNGIQTHLQQFYRGYTEDITLLVHEHLLYLLSHNYLLDVFLLLPCNGYYPLKDAEINDLALQLERMVFRGDTVAGERGVEED